MGRAIGIISLILVFLFAALFLLHLWGVIHINIFTYLKSGITLIILGGCAAFAFIIWAMFFWRGNQGPKPGERPQKSKF